MSDRALDGLRVIECGSMISAPYCGKVLADLGAEVIKIEPPSRGDEARYRGPFPDDRPAPEKSGLFLYLNCNKLGVTLDLHHKDGQVLLRDLVRECDILVHNFHPVVADDLGLTYEALNEYHKSLIVTSISRFGRSGSYRDYVGYEITSAHGGGWAYLSPPGLEDPHLPPLKAFGHQADFQAGITAAMASMAALFARENTGGGQDVDISVQECIAAALELAFTHYSYAGSIVSRTAPWSMSPVKPIQCRDGMILVFTPQEEQWQRFVHMLGDPEWANWDIFRNREERMANWDALEPLVAEWMRERTVDEVYQMASEFHLPFAPVSTMGDVLASEHLKIRGFFASIAHPTMGNLSYPGAPYKLSETPWELRQPAPLLGQHNELVYRDRLGLSQETLRLLRIKGVI